MVNRAVPSPGQRAWWLLPELLTLVPLMLLVVAGVELTAGPAPGLTLNDQLAHRVSQALENASPAEHHDHGHDIEAGWTVVCAAEIYGTDPPGASSVGQVKIVYAYYMCAAGAPGTPYDGSSRASGPCMVRLSDPPVVTIAQAGLGHDVRVRDDAGRVRGGVLQGFPGPHHPARAA